MRVVILEDDDSLCLMLRVMLELDCYATVVGETGNGHDGLVLIRQLAPDVAVIDLHLTQLSGLEVIRAARSEQLPVGLIAYSADAVMCERAAAAGAHSTICKSIDPTELSAAVSQMFTAT